MLDKKLIGEIVKRELLTTPTIQDMYNLMSTYHENVKRENFDRDLAMKDASIILRDGKTNSLKGFSTLRVLEEKIDSDENRALFSGDTIIDKKYWGTSELPKMWLQYAFKRMKEKPEVPFYWFLISKGYKTYRFLPVFCKDFSPRYDAEKNEELKKVLDAFAYSKFPNNYNPKTGLITFGGKKDYLKEGVADIDEKRLRDPHVKYFTEINPNWAKGDELACITRISRDNLKRRTLMLLGDI